MPDADDACLPPKISHWGPDDMTFAAAQLAQEFPAVSKDKVIAAVNSAAPFVPPAEGRVRLMRQARTFLRPA